MLTQEQITLLIKSNGYIVMDRELRSELRRQLAELLKYFTEDNPKEVSIKLDKDDYPSNMEEPVITTCWKNGDYLYFQIKDYGTPTEFDGFSTMELIHIYKHII